MKLERMKLESSQRNCKVRAFSNCPFQLHVSRHCWSLIRPFLSSKPRSENLSRIKRDSGNLTVTDDVFENIQNGCGDIPELNPSTSRDEIYKIVDDQPCVSAVCFGWFKIILKLTLLFITVRSWYVDLMVQALYCKLYIETFKPLK